MLEIRKCSFAEVEGAPNFAALVAEYGGGNIASLGEPSAQLDAYRKLAETGLFHIICAFRDDALVGFLSMIVTVLPHYGRKIATSESFFVAESERKTGAGLKLLREAERFGLSLEAEGILLTAPYGGPLAQVLPECGYEETHSVFFKPLRCTH